MKTPEERRAAADARQAKFEAKQAERQARIDAAKAKRRAALDEAATIPGQIRDVAANAWAEGQAAGQVGVDAAKAKQQELYARRDELGEQVRESLKTRNILGFKRRTPRD